MRVFKNWPRCVGELEESGGKRRKEEGSGGTTQRCEDNNDRDKSKVADGGIDRVKIDHMNIKN